MKASVFIAMVCVLTAGAETLSPRQVAITVAAKVEADYAIAAVASKAAAMLRKDAERGAYDRLSGESLAQKLTADLQAVSGDKHMIVRFSAGGLDADKRDTSFPPDYESFKNYGVKDVARLDGNIGYLKIDGFGAVAPMQRKLAEAFAIIEQTDGLILDLRDNGGGQVLSVAKTASYLFDGEPFLLNQIVARENSDVARERPELVRMFAKIYTERVAEFGYGSTKPVWVLISAFTFSGGEELAYDLQALKRATVIGTRSKGGANPVYSYRIDDHFLLGAPWGCAQNPVTGRNWEGIGVAPDVEVQSHNAFLTAYKAALSWRLERETHPMKRAEAEQALANLNAYDRHSMH